MKKTIAAALGSLVLALGLLVGFQQPAQASPLCDINDSWCGSITHYSPDYGMDAPFLIRCRWGDSTSTRWLYEGQASTSLCDSAEGVDQVYVGSGRKIVCLSTYGWITRYDAAGWHKIYDGQHPVCVYQNDDESES